MSEELNVSEAEQVLERIVRNQITIRELEEENDALKGFFKDRPDTYDAGTTKIFGRFFIRVSRNQRFDPVAAAKAYPESKYKHLYKSVIDSKLVRQYLGAERAEAVSKKYDNRIEIGLVD